MQIPGWYAGGIMTNKEEIEPPGFRLKKENAFSRPFLVEVLKICI